MRRGDSKATSAVPVPSKTASCSTSFVLRSRQESDERETVRRKTGNHQRGRDRRGAGQDGHRYPLGGAGPHQAEPRIGETGHARVGDQRHFLALPQKREQGRQALLLVVVVEAHQPGGDAVPVEQDASVPRILAGDQVDPLEHLQHAQGDVLQIPDGCSTDVEHVTFPAAAGQPMSPPNASQAASPPPTRPALLPRTAATTLTWSRSGAIAVLSHHLARRLEEQFAQFAHPASDHDHLGVEDVGHVHQPDPQPAGQLSHRLQRPGMTFLSQPGHGAPGEPASSPEARARRPRDPSRDPRPGRPA